MVGHMNVSFLRAIAYILEEHEGGESNLAADPGGRTRFGISETYFPAVWKMPGGPTLTAALEIYWNEFWVSIKADEIKHAALRNKLFDIAINMGPGRAGKMLQESLNILVKQTTPLKVDGQIGQVTLGVLNAYRNQRSIVFMLGALMVDRYRQNPNAATFLAGWLVRANWNGVS